MILRIALAAIAFSSLALARGVPKCDTLITSSTYPIVGTSKDYSMTKRFLALARELSPSGKAHVINNFRFNVETSRTRPSTASYDAHLYDGYRPIVSEYKGFKTPEYAKLRLSYENVQQDPKRPAQWKMTGKAAIEVYRVVPGKKAHEQFEEIEDLPLRFVGYKYVEDSRDYVIGRYREYEADIKIDGKRTVLLVNIYERNAVYNILSDTIVPIWVFEGRYGSIGIK